LPVLRGNAVLPKSFGLLIRIADINYALWKSAATYAKWSRTALFALFSGDNVRASWLHREGSKESYNGIRNDVGDDPPDPAIVELRLKAGWRFWLAIVLTGVGTGACAAGLMLILQTVQHFVWPGTGATLLDAAYQATPWRHVLVLLGAGLVTGAGQIILVSLTASNSIDITEAIWFSAGRLPALRTLGSAVLSVVVVGMGASLGREGAPKQAGAVIANALSDRAAFPTNNADFWSRAVQGPAWPRPMACRWAGRYSRWRCCAECWLCGLCCLRS